MIIQNGVVISKTSKNKFAAFEQAYIEARNKEQRIFTINEIRNLPEVPKDHVHYSEWQIRKKNIKRFLNYLDHKNKSLRILDIGCGTGFFTHSMAKGHTVCGLDVNLTELTQAAEAFKDSGITWYYFDIMEEELPEGKFDLITFCASFQYFDDPIRLLNKCKNMLTKNGEIHIIDSAFYNEQSREQAKQGSLNYYKKLGSESMINYYHHNTYALLDGFNYSFGYKANPLMMKFRKDSPFPWIIVKADH